MPFQMALFWLINGGDPNHLVSEMIPQEGLGKGNSAISCWEGQGPFSKSASLKSKAMTSDL